MNTNEIDILREADALKEKAKYSDLMDKVIRERRMEEWVRARDASDIAEHIIWLEDDAADKESRIAELEEKVRLGGSR